MPCEETSLSPVTIVWEGYLNILWRLEMSLSGGGGIVGKEDWLAVE